MPDPAYLDALVDYRVMFPTIASLGEGNPPAAWEEARLAARVALDAVQGTSATLEGGSVSGFRNFPQYHKLRAIYAVRAELDEEYVNPYTLPAEDPVPMQRMGSILRLE